MKRQNNTAELFHTVSLLITRYPIISFRFIIGNILVASIQIITIGSLYPVISTIIGEGSSSVRLIRYYNMVLGFLGLDVSLLNYLILFVAGGVVSFLMYALLEQDKGRFLRNFEAQMRISILEKIIYSKWQRLKKLNHGEFISVVSHEADSYRVVVFYIFEMITRCIQILIFSYFIFRVNFIFALVSYLLLFLGFVIFMPIMKISARIGHDTSDAYTRLSDSLVNACRSFKNIKAGSLEGFLLGRLKKNVTSVANIFYKSQIVSSIFHTKLFELLGYAILACLLFIGIQVLKMDKAQIFLVLVLLFRLVPMVTALSDEICRTYGHLPSLSRIAKIKEESGGEEEMDGRYCVIDKPLERIYFENVSFGYGLKKLLFNALTVEFKKGEFWAICGPTGSGKTTILDLISGISELSSGRIIYNEVDSKEVNLESLHQKVNYLTQHNFIFAGTILENICWGNENPDLSLLDEVLRLSRLDDLVKQKTLNFLVSESGQNLSVGEQQRISIARALLEKCDFILMDEPTSALDEKTENEFLGSLASLKGKVGVIMVTHKKEYLRYADHILRFSGNKLEVSTSTGNGRG